MAYLKFREFPVLGPSAEPVQQLVILLHGYGANGEDLLSLASTFVNYIPQAHFIAPDAPYAYEGAGMITTPGAYQWFSMMRDSEEYMLQGINNVIPILQQFIDDQLKRLNLSSDRLVLLGFSQGGMLALHTALHAVDSRTPKAVVSYSGMLVAPQQATIQYHAPHIKILLVHGQQDPVVPAIAANRTYDILKANNVDVTLSMEPSLGHCISMNGIATAGKFLKSCF